MRLIRFLRVVVTLCLILFSSKAFAGFTEGLAFARAGNFDAAIAELTPLADKGDVNSQYVLATIYRKDVKNPKFALKYMAEASKNGSLKATNYMGLWNLQGYHDLVDVDENKAIEIFVYVAEWKSDRFKADKAYANGMLARIFGRRGEQDKQLRYYRQSAALGHRFQLDYARTLMSAKPSNELNIGKALMWADISEQRAVKEKKIERAAEAANIVASILDRIDPHLMGIAADAAVQCEKNPETCDSTIEKLYSASLGKQAAQNPINGVQSSSLPPCQNSVFHNCFSEQTHTNGSVYIGEWKNEKPHGQVSVTFKSGNTYVGEYKNGKRDGQGTFKWAKSGNVYVGEYKDGKRSGQGTYKYASGDTYVGEFKNNKRDGQGTFKYASGDTYVGEWRDDDFDGLGTYRFADGSQKKGKWVAGELATDKEAKEKAKRAAVAQKKERTSHDLSKCNVQKYAPKSLACNWYADGSGALSDTEYKQLCAKATGFTINSKEHAGVHNGVNRQFVDGASLVSSAVQWRANAGARKTGLCLATMTINGVLQGTSKTEVFEGYVVDFVNINGKILVNTFGWY